MQVHRLKRVHRLQRPDQPHPGAPLRQGHPRLLRPVRLQGLRRSQPHTIPRAGDADRPHPGETPHQSPPVRETVRTGLAVGRLGQRLRRQVRQVSAW